MGAYVLLLKELEDVEKVIYRFGPNEDSMGKIQLNKITGKFTEIEPIPDLDGVYTLPVFKVSLIVTCVLSSEITPTIPPIVRLPFSFVPISVPVFRQCLISATVPS